MRASRAWCLGILGVMLGAQGCSHPVDPPKQRSGLWEETSVQVVPSQTVRVGTDMIQTPAQTIKVSVKSCVGTTSAGAKQPLSGITEVMQSSCMKSETHVLGSTTTVDVVCKSGQWQTRTHSVMTLQGDTAFQQESDTHTVTPYGSSDGHMTLAAKWVGSTCPAGMRPGDVMGPDGRIMRAAPDGSLITVGTGTQ